MSQISDTRERWIDCWKGLLILLVVVGHVVGGGEHLAQAQARDFFYQTYKVIYAFHMAAFFAVAGMLDTRDDVSWREFLKKKALRLLVPYFCIGVVSAVIYGAFQSQFFQSVAGQTTTSYYAAIQTVNWGQLLVSLVHAGGWPNGDGFRMNGVLWFLPCLFSAQVLFKLLKDFLNRSSVAKGLTLVVCLVLAFLCRRFSLLTLPWGLSLVPYFMLFMVFGNHVLPRVVSAWTRGQVGNRLGIPLGIVISIAYVMVIVFLPDLSCAFEQFSWFVVYTVVALGGVVLSALGAHVLARKTGARALAVLGVHSMGVMLFHKYGVLAFQVKLAAGRALFSQDMMHAVLGVVLVTCLAAGLALVASWACLRWVPWILGASRKRNLYV